ncbi:hypothetical protein V6N13_058153 [Hibiscus sabdariffa]
MSEDAMKKRVAFMLVCSPCVAASVASRLISNIPTELRIQKMYTHAIEVSSVVSRIETRFTASSSRKLRPEIFLAVGPGLCSKKSSALHPAYLISDSAESAKLKSCSQKRIYEQPVAASQPFHLNNL